MKRFFSINNYPHRKITVICVILLLFGIAVMPVIDHKTVAMGRSKQLFENRFKGSIIYIIASDSYDYGVQIGKIFRLQYKLLDILACVTNNKDFNKKEIEDQIKVMEERYPYFLDELKGLSEGTNIKLDRLLFLQNSLRSIRSGECTATLATGNATKNNETFMTMSADAHSAPIYELLILFGMHSWTYKLWVVRINTMKYRYAFIGIPIIVEYTLINEKGLAWSQPGIRFTKNESRYIDEGPGISTYMLDRFCMMTCKNVSEVANLYKNIERASGTYDKWPHHWDSSASCWADKEGGILEIEQTHNYIITLFGNSTDITGSKEGILWQSNHHQWLDPNLTGSVFTSEYPSSGLREERARELLENNYGNITLEVCKEITRDHSGGFDKDGKDPGDLCRHPYNDNPRITAFSYIVQPKEMTVYLTHRAPCRSMFWKHDFSKIFGE